MISTHKQEITSGESGKDKKPFSGAMENILKQPAIRIISEDSEDIKLMLPAPSDEQGEFAANTGDPPGQQSTYIPPGNCRREVYRLSTFENYPNADANIRKALASHGFYFTGFADQVKCFNCARSIVRWVSGDNPADPKWHKTSCAFSRGQPCGNIPITNNSEREFPVSLCNRVNITRCPHSQLETDSVHSKRERDLPGQNCIYIPPAENVPIVTNHAARIRGWIAANVVSADHKRYLETLYLERELDRLASFVHWHSPNNLPAVLAKTGFYYLGDMDRVQCFSCGGILRNWTREGDAAAQHRRFSSTCNMVTGNEPQNIPIPTSTESLALLAVNYPLRFPSHPHMSSQSQREATFGRRWPTGRTNVSYMQIAEAGFFYLGEHDRVKCWYCGGGIQNWENDDIPWNEHAKWYPTCQFLLRTKGQQYVHRHLGPFAHVTRLVIGKQYGSPLENDGRKSYLDRGYSIFGTNPPNISIPVPESPEVLALTYSMRFPSNPNMRSQAQREATFIDRWRPCGRINATIRQITEAGFFCFGEPDRVKCWYCNGTLEHWEHDYVPWEVHANRFPNCQFLLQAKGQRFVQNHSGTHAHLQRPMFRRMHDSTSHIPPVARSLPMPPATIIPDEETIRRKERVKRIMRTSKIVKTVLRMGFSVQIVETVIEDRIRLNNDCNDGFYGSVSEFLIDIMNKEDEQRRNGTNLGSSERRNLFLYHNAEDIWDDELYGEDPSNHQENAVSSVRGQQNAATTESLQQQIARTVNERMCKTCFIKAADTSFTPCSHMVCCFECANRLPNCPFCGIQIKAYLKIRTT